MHLIGHWNGLIKVKIFFQTLAHTQWITGDPPVEEIESKCCHQHLQLLQCFNRVQKLTLSTNTEGATIYYTTDGTDPTIASTKYTTPIIINEETTIKAIAVKDGLENSDVSTFTYSILAALESKTILEARTALNETVQIEGIVTTEAGPWGTQAFYMQDDTAGMYIYTGSANVQPGNKIRVTGKSLRILQK